MIAIIDYKAGNLTSVKLAFQALKVEAEITNNAGTILAAERVVFPGVGAAGAAMTYLNQTGLAKIIQTKIGQGSPFLGICFGMQLLFEFSEEDGGVPCLAVLAGQVKRFNPIHSKYKIPHMGWNSVTLKKSHPLLAGIENESEFYFVHSYYPHSADDTLVFGQTDYAEANFASIVGRGNVLATQFHPEKSGRIGLKLLENFSRWDGAC
ncbi:MAG: imidazole glycerol phosphate synthase subunit HisH [Anaerolineae bacterium]|nr:imidazole glycerol phosphate synthase subunit HisH [Anaerolineae bacterium]